MLSRNEIITNFSLVFVYWQIKREISTMKLIKHPNVTQMFEVISSIFILSKKKITGVFVMIVIVAFKKKKM